MIRFQEVSKRYSNGYVALNDVSFHLAAGEFAFLTGHSGAGKSTLLRLIAALDTASEGHILVGKQNLEKLSRRQIPALRRRIGIILQTPNLLADRTVADNIALPLIVAGHSYREIESRVRAVMAKVSLVNKAKHYPMELSTGEQQRVAIARAIINKPPLLIADEPTGNLDPDLAAEIMYFFQQLNGLGMTVLIASHDLALINRLKHRVLVLEKGNLCSS